MAASGPKRHVAAAQPAELLCLDTFYIGQLKVVGKVQKRAPTSIFFGVVGALAELMQHSGGVKTSTPTQI